MYLYTAITALLAVTNLFNNNCVLADKENNSSPIPLHRNNVNQSSSGASTEENIITSSLPGTEPPINETTDPTFDSNFPTTTSGSTHTATVTVTIYKKETNTEEGIEHSSEGLSTGYPLPTDKGNTSVPNNSSHNEKEPNTTYPLVSTTATSLITTKYRSKINTGESSNNGYTNDNEATYTDDETFSDEDPTLDSILPVLMIAESRFLYWNNLDGYRMHPLLYCNGTGHYYSVDYHYSENLVFFSAFVNEVYFIGRIKVNYVFPAGEEEIVIWDLPGPTYLAIDWINYKLYWTSLQDGSMEMANLDGSERTLLPPCNSTKDIAVDPYTEDLFYIADRTIFRCDLDARNCTAIVLGNKEDMDITALALDRIKEKMYFFMKKEGERFLVTKGYEYNSKAEYIEMLTHEVVSMDVNFGKLVVATRRVNVLPTDNIYIVNPSATQSNEQLTLVYVPKYNESVIFGIRVYHPDVQNP